MIHIIEKIWVTTPLFVDTSTLPIFFQKVDAFVKHLSFLNHTQKALPSLSATMSSLENTPCTPLYLPESDSLKFTDLSFLDPIKQYSNLFESPKKRKHQEEAVEFRDLLKHRKLDLYGNHSKLTSQIDSIDMYIQRCVDQIFEKNQEMDYLNCERTKQEEEIDLMTDLDNLFKKNDSQPFAIPKETKLGMLIYMLVIAETEERDIYFSRNGHLATLASLTEEMLKRNRTRLVRRIFRPRNQKAKRSAVSEFLSKNKNIFLANKGSPIPVFETTDKQNIYDRMRDDHDNETREINLDYVVLNIPGPE